MRLSSYQRRKRDIAYYEQCVSELRGIAKEMARDMAKAGIPLKLHLRGGICGDQLLTPYNTGEFEMQLLSEYASAKK